MTIAIAWMVFASLLSPPLLLIVIVAWLCGAHALLLVPLAVWIVSTAWMAANAGMRHHRRREKFLDALVSAPCDIVEQLARLIGRRPPLRSI